MFVVSEVQLKSLKSLKTNFYLLFSNAITCYIASVDQRSFNSKVIDSI